MFLRVVWLCALLGLALPMAAGSDTTPERAPERAPEHAPEQMGRKGASSISAADSASEYWDLLARLDSGHLVFVRVLITNEGPGVGSAAAFGYVVRPDGSSVRFDNAQPAGGWSLSDDGLRIQVNSSTFDLSAARPKFEYDSNKRGVKLHLWFDPDGVLVRPRQPALRNYRLELLDPAAPVHGTLWLRGMDAPIPVKGTLGMTHTWMEKSEADLLARRIDFFSLSDDTAIYLSVLTFADGQRARWLVLRRGPLVVYASEDLELDFEPPLRPSPYPVPAVVRLRTPELDGVIRLDSLLLEVNPLEALPAPLRWLKSLSVSPRHAWSVSPFKVTLRAGPEASEQVFRGAGITSLAFPNPFSPGYDSAPPIATSSR